MTASQHSRLARLLAEAHGQGAALAAAMARRAQADSAALEGVLQQALEEGVQGRINTLPEPLTPPTEHRRAHRPGTPRRLDADPELQAFVRARIDRMTYQEIAEAVAAHFPPGRRVARSAIHDWWKRNRPDRRRT